MVTYLPRSAWGARTAEGSNALVRSEVQGTALHWPGMSARIDATGDAGARRIASALRGWQAYHMDDRGWSDIAYQIAIDQAGRAWVLRGLNIRSGANGNQTVNRAYGAVLLVLGPGEEPSSAMKATTRGVVADFRRWFPAGTAIRPHSAVRPDGTDCPGDRARAAIARGDFTPGLVTGDDDDMSAEDVRALTGVINTATAAQAARIENTLKSAVTDMQRAVEAAGRRWALYGVLYGLETEDDREAAREAYREVRESGGTEAAAMAAAEAKLAGLRATIKEAQSNA